MRAFTIIEAVMCMIVVALMMAAGFSVAGHNARARLVIAEQRTADLLSRQLLTEVIQRRYRDNSGTTTLGPDAGESQASRLTLNDIDDYDALDLSPPVAIDGRSLSNASNWKQSVSVKYVKLDPATKTFIDDPSDTGIKRITVTTRSPRGVVSTVTALRSASGLGTTHTPDAGTQRWIGLAVTPSAGSQLTTSVPLENFPAP